MSRVKKEDIRIGGRYRLPAELNPTIRTDLQGTFVECTGTRADGTFLFRFLDEGLDMRKEEYALFNYHIHMVPAGFDNNEEAALLLLKKL